MAQGHFTRTLSRHRELSARVRKSKVRLKQVIAKARKYRGLSSPNVSVYVAGSLGRLETGRKSDLDVFVVANRPTRGETPSITRLEEYQLFSSLIRINEALHYPDLSGDGRFLKVYELSEMIRATGSPRDDSENLFTARMLLLLESRPITNPFLFNKCQRDILQNYFRDGVGKKDFRPLFLLNDVLRYWRTLCLNYEEHRIDPHRPWYKKNLNLKFSRKLTIFSTVLLLLCGRTITRPQFIQLCMHSPIQRLALALDEIDDENLAKPFEDMLDDYEDFLRAKESGDVEENTRSRRGALNQSARRFGNFFHQVIDSPRIDGTLRPFVSI